MTTDPGEERVDEVESALESESRHEPQRASRKGPKQMKAQFEENQPLVEILESLHDEYAADCVVNYGNVGDVVMRVPATKQKWVSRYCKYRSYLADLERKFKSLLDSEAKSISSKSPVAMTPTAAMKAASRSESRTVRAFSERIDLVRRINDDLSEILKHVHFLNTEVAAIVDFMKMENS